MIQHKLKTMPLIEQTLGEMTAQIAKINGCLSGSSGVLTPLQAQQLRHMACDLNMMAATVACEVTNVEVSRND